VNASPGEPSPDSSQQPAWQPLSAKERRIVGVLVEKAKTTPDSYPLTINALRNGCNQKSNRFPQMQLEDEDIEDALERLRHLGAVTEISGDSRVAKFRHRLYEWLVVDKVEMAVMAELLLRGAQTIGELRGRAARMEPIDSLAQLQPILTGLYERGLITFLTPRGRGCVVTHCLYQPQELDKLRREYGTAEAAAAADPMESPTGAPPRAMPAASSPEGHRAAEGHGAAETIEQPPQPPATSQPAFSAIRDREPETKLAELVNELKQQLDDCRQQVAELQSEHQSLLDQVDDIKRQLGI